MIAISITNYNDINLAKAFYQAYEKKNDVYMHFSSTRWIELFGDVECRHGSDLEYFLLHSNNFEVLVTFSAPPNIAQKYNYTLVSCFNALGIQTVEIQHGLFQYGINNIDEVLKCGFNEYGEGWGLEIKYPAKNIIKWSGKNGIGYLKSSYYQNIYESNNNKLLFKDDFTLIVSNNNWHIYSEYERFSFITCIVKLVENNKKDLFVWKPHPAELSLDTVKVLKKYKLKNLRILGNEYIVDYPAERLIKECKYGISMVSTALIDFEINDKQVIVFDATPVGKLLNKFNKVLTFKGYTELLQHYDLIKTNKTDGRLVTGINNLDSSLLNKLINQIRIKSECKYDSRIILEYLDRFAYIRIPDPYEYIVERDFRKKENGDNINQSNIKSMLFQNTHSTYSIEEILRSIEQRIKIQSDRGTISSHSSRDLLLKLDVVHKKLYDYQKSTISYKLKKLFPRIK